MQGWPGLSFEAPALHPGLRSSAPATPRRDLDYLKNNRRIHGGTIMPQTQPVTIGKVVCGPGHPLVWIAGPCVIESHDLTMRIAETLAELAGRLALPLVFKASFDKANRTSSKSFR